MKGKMTNRVLDPLRWRCHKDIHVKLSSKLMWVERSEPETGVINGNYIVEVMEMDKMTKEEKLERIGIRTLETTSICGLEKESRRQDHGGQEGSVPI